MALFTWYLFGLDIFLFVLQKLSGVFSSVFGQSLGVWVSGLSLAVIVLFAILAMRWAKAKLLWRLRNRLIVTYVFIGVIPVILLVALALGSFYLFAGQFATFIVTTRLDAELTSLEASTSATANNMAGVISEAGAAATSARAHLNAAVSAGNAKNYSKMKNEAQAASTSFVRAAR